MDFKINRHRVSILYWFLCRPTLYKQLVRELYSFIKRENHPSLDRSEDAHNWCENRAITEREVLSRICKDHEFQDIQIRNSLILEKATKIIESKRFDWGGQGNISLNYNLANALKAISILETGVAYGWSSLSFLLSLNERNIGNLTSIDMPFFGINNEQDIGCVIPSQLKDRWNLIRLADKDGIPKVFSKIHSIDLCHYDSDKSYNGKMWALPRLWKHLRPGGILVCDDASDNLAFKDFSETVNAEPMVINTFDTKAFKHVGLLIKPE